MEVLIKNNQNRHPISKMEIRKTVQLILNGLDYPDAELSLLITDDSEMASFNSRYRGKEGSTNVISFPMQEGEFSDISPDLLGDVVISVDTAEREAKEMSIEFKDRLNELLVHGILHLVGYDHEQSEKETLVMEAKTEELMKLITGGI
ncbi:MAG: rRNA maturation RNase YbeY [Desulfobacterales bacterium]|nr:rRNA maturation RNase YbeY [Desulfobacterales bacterium]